MPKRYIGDAVIDIEFKGSTPDGDEYVGSITVGEHVWKFDNLYAPRIGFCSGVAYDSPLAYDDMACSAASFGSYYTTDNRGHEDDLKGYPSAEVADAIDEAVNWAYTDEGNYQVLREKEK